jgi:hypothetical protein
MTVSLDGGGDGPAGFGMTVLFPPGASVRPSGIKTRAPHLAKGGS